MQSIIIIGAGAAGLMAASILSETRHVIVLEGSNRLGGRIHTLNNEGFSYAAEAGAEFIHGNLALTLQLLKEAGLETLETGGEMATSRNGKWVARDRSPEGWASMMQQMHKLQEDTTLELFLLRYFSEPTYAKMCDRARAFAQGYDVADPTKVSVFFLRDEWGAGWDDQYRIKGGYGLMTDYLAAKCIKNGGEIHTNAPVNKLQWGKNSVTAFTENGATYSAAKAVITVPAGVLQNAAANAHISFNPAINGYMQAAANIGYGGVVKVLLEFKTAFWNEYKPGLGFMFCDQFIPTWWTQAPDETPVITGWLGGPKADTLANTPEATILGKSIQSLATVFGIPAATLQSQLVIAKAFNWPANPFSLGGYSYATPLTNKALGLLNTPVEDTLYFAGEALYNGAHPGTVEAALVSGKDVAEKILGPL